MKFIIIFVLAVNIIATVSAIKCYSCEKCYKPKPKHLIECEANKNECVEILEYSQRIKKYVGNRHCGAASNGKSSCEIEKMATLEYYKDNSEKIAYYEAYYENCATCDTDACNKNTKE